MQQAARVQSREADERPPQRGAQEAAGLLARMRPEAAAAVMTGMKPESAYAVTVTIASRNAAVPKA